MQELHCGMKMIYRTMSFTKLNGMLDGQADEALCPLDSVAEWVALSEESCDGGRQGTAGAMSVDGVEPLSCQMVLIVAEHQDVGCFAVKVAAFDQDIARAEGL